MGELTSRVVLAAGLVLLATLIVWFDGNSYVDNTAGDGVSFIDALYYATVSVTTTGYGDITPVTPQARLISALVITPIRICFLVILVGTTIEVLANEGRRRMADTKWRKTMRNHCVLIGYGTKGRAAAQTMQRQGVPATKIVVIDSSADAIAAANRDGIAAFEGDATARDLLRQAEISKALEVVITLDRDDTTILTTLTARQLNPTAHIVASVREHDNAPLVRQSGATAVVTSSEAVGRLMGLSTVDTHLGLAIQDLLTVGEGMEIQQRLATAKEIGQRSDCLPDQRVIAIVRNDTLRRFYDPTAATIEHGDELIVICRSRTSPTPESRGD